MGEKLDAGWPFLHQSLYGSNYWVRFNPRGPTGSWFIGIGTEEWGLARLGLTSMRKLTELLADSPCRDHYLQIQQHGHAITDAQIVESARTYRRMELAFAPLFLPPDYPEATLKPIMQSANDLALGPAAAGVQRVLAQPGLAAPLKDKAERLKAAIARRVENIFAVSAELAKDDLVLADYYEPLYAKQLKGHPREKELRELFAAGRKGKDAKKAVAVYRQFQQNFKDYFTEASCKPDAKTSEFLKQALPVVGERSQFARMAGEFLLLRE
jgi:hypothetical protein